MTNIALVLNAGAGGLVDRDTSSVARRLEQALRDQGMEVTSILSEPRELPGALDKALDSAPDMLAVAGGDGTVNAAARRLAGQGPPLGVIPLGTLNHFAKDLHLPLDPVEAAAALTSGATTRVDTGEVNGRPFVNNSSIGIYPRAVLRREAFRRQFQLPKMPSMALALWQTVMRMPNLELAIDVDGSQIRATTPFLFVGNNCYEKEGLTPVVRKSLSSGRLSVYYANRPGRLELMMGLLRSALIGMEDTEDLANLWTARLRVACLQPRQEILAVSLDGEVVRLSPPLNYSIRPASLEVATPTENS